MRVGLVVVLLAALAACASSPSSSTGSTSSSDSDPASAETSERSSSSGSDASPAEMLATIDGSSNVAAYQRALDQASQVCTQSESRLGDMAVRSVQLLEEEGVTETNLSMLQAAGNAVPNEMAPTDCTEIFGSLILMMSQ